MLLYACSLPIGTYQPVRTTYSSDYFDQLYEFAIQLIKQVQSVMCVEVSPQLPLPATAAIVA